jgi:two-component system sensor histidine kinase/response regulator
MTASERYHSGLGDRTMDISTLFDALLEHLPDAVGFKDAQGRYVRVNKTLASWYGLDDPQKAVGKSDADFFPPEFTRANADVEREILETGAPRLNVEEKLVGLDGRVHWMSTSRFPLPGGGVLVFFQDVGALQHAKDEVRRAETLYRSLVDNLPQNFFRKDHAGRVVYANKQYCLTLGKATKELLGKTDFDLFPEKLARKYREDDARVMQTGVPLDVVEAHQPPGKGIIYVRVVKTPVYDAERKAVGVQGIFWEVARAKAEAAPSAKKKVPAKRKARAKAKR